MYFKCKNVSDFTIITNVINNILREIPRFRQKALDSDVYILSMVSCSNVNCDLL